MVTYSRDCLAWVLLPCRAATAYLSLGSGTYLTPRSASSRQYVSRCTTTAVSAPLLSAVSIGERNVHRNQVPCRTRHAGLFESVSSRGEFLRSMVVSSTAVVIACATAGATAGAASAADESAFAGEVVLSYYLVCIFTG